MLILYVDYFARSRCLKSRTMFVSRKLYIEAPNTIAHTIQLKNLFYERNLACVYLYYFTLFFLVKTTTKIIWLQKRNKRSILFKLLWKHTHIQLFPFVLKYKNTHIQFGGMMMTDWICMYICVYNNSHLFSLLFHSMRPETLNIFQVEKRKKPTTATKNKRMQKKRVHKFFHFSNSKFRSLFLSVTTLCVCVFFNVVCVCCSCRFRFHIFFSLLTSLSFNLRKINKWMMQCRKYIWTWEQVCVFVCICICVWHIRFPFFVYDRMNEMTICFFVILNK